ncbi:hypothetical protein DYB32_006295 [Aphanomyces invadans]|uniref:Uncharacterized protein n=1 Tax=Aphanomyces invadans TaxID=157072 RepID=A0A3R6ZNB8_9STRA|nr:hypothetical protein DYB32_006295 [Aphanomyces invadans]
MLTRSFLQFTRPQYTKAVLASLHPIVAHYHDQCHGDLAMLAHSVESDVKAWSCVPLTLWTHMANDYLIPLALPDPPDSWWPAALELLR